MLSTPLRRWRIAAAQLAAAVLCFSATEAQGQINQGTLDVVTVEIPTRVVDKAGNPVRDLTAKNFEVLEGKSKQSVVRVEVVDLGQTSESGGRPWSEPVPTSARRRLLFVFDLSFSSGASIARAREGVLEMLAGGLHPSDLVGVARYSSARGVEMILGLTSDLHQAREAVHSLGVVDPAYEVNDPLRLMLVDLDAARRNDLGGVGAELDPAEGVIAQPVDKTEEIFLHLRDLIDEQSKVVRDEQQRPILAMASALSGLAGELASIPGYKQVVFLSEGFDDSVLSGTTDQQRVTQLSQATAVSDVFQVDSDELYGAGEVRRRLLEMTAEFERADCSIHAVDIGGLRAGTDARQEIEGLTGGPGAASSDEGLFLMASETGGQFIRGQNNLAKAMQQVLERTALTYILVLEPPDLILDGSYHPVDVQIRRAPKGARALHRPGYFAPLPYRGTPGEARRLGAAEMISSGEDGGPVATGVLTAAFPTAGKKVDVVAWVEMYGYGLLAGSPGDRLPVELYAYAFRPDGSIADFATQVAVVDLRRHRQRLEAQGFKHIVRLGLEPGSYYLRTFVRNAITGASGLKTQRLEVPSFGPEAATILPPLFIEPEGLWVLGWGQDVSNNASEELAYPLQLGGQRLVPSADPLLPRGVEVPLILVGFDLPGAPASIEARLIPTSGGEALPAAAVLDGHETVGDGLSLWARVKAVATTLPGKYELRVRAIDASGGSAESAPITVYVR